MNMLLRKKKSPVRNNKSTLYCEGTLRSKLCCFYFPFLFILLFSCKQNPPLPILGEVDFDAKGDTIYHTIPAFSFPNQNGKIITDKDYAGKIYVSDFFFTTCGTICPKMTNQLLRVQEEFESDKDVLILSFTVNPEVDSIAVLKAYAKAFGANENKWNFCTGSKAKLYKLAQKGFLLIKPEVDVNNPSQFLHSEYFNLVDRKGRIRGVYDGTDSTDVSRLINDIKTLQDEDDSSK